VNIIGLLAMKKRDYNIEKQSRQELDLRTKAIKSKKKYTRKTKHKGKDV
jgi:hypothetical protein